MRIAAIAAIAFALALATGCSRGQKTCAVCEREECKGLAFRVRLETGKTVETCCPRCGLHYVSTAKQKARTWMATDYPSGQWIDATKATYVSGSDVAHCAMKETKRDAYGCCAFKDFDRCLPSLIAFADTTSAQTFQKQHGGEVVGFEKIAPN